MQQKFKIENAVDKMTILGIDVVNTVTQVNREGQHTNVADT